MRRGHRCWATALGKLVKVIHCFWNWNQLFVLVCQCLCSPITVRLSAQMYTPLHAAAASGQISVVKLLLELGVEVDAVNIYGNTALHVACLNGQDIVVSKLLEFHAAVNAVNHKGMVRPGLWNVVVSLSLDLAFLFIVDFIVS